MDQCFPRENFCVEALFHSTRLVNHHLLTILHCPVAYHNDHGLRTNDSRSRFIDAGWIWDKGKLDPRYVSNSDIEWTQILKCIENLNMEQEKLKIGLLNFNISEINQWRQSLPYAGFSPIQLDHAPSNLTWDVLYPEWIDEEQESEVPHKFHIFKIEKQMISEGKKPTSLNLYKTTHRKTSISTFAKKSKNSLTSVYHQ